MGLIDVQWRVETAAQLDVLRGAGCTLIQGFLLSQPLSLTELLTSYPGGRWQCRGPDRPAGAGV